jgi:hypothetical protein
MKTRKTLLTLALAATASTLSLALSAEALAPASASPSVPAASAPSGAKFKIVDQKTSAVRYAYATAQSEFVGTSAPATILAVKKPSWYAFGHP